MFVVHVTEVKPLAQNMQVNVSADADTVTSHQLRMNAASLA